MTPRAGSAPPTLQTPRLILRPWIESDVDEFIAMTADIEIMRFVTGEPFTRARAEANVPYFRDGLVTKGYGWWTTEVRETGAFAGFIGLQDVSDRLPFAPAIEVGWLLHRSAWGNGYATEGARVSLDFAFDELDLEEVVALTAAANVRSRNVMQRLHMTYDPADDFSHPRLPPDSPLQPGVVYRIRRTVR